MELLFLNELLPRVNYDKSIDIEIDTTIKNPLLIITCIKQGSSRHFPRGKKLTKKTTVSEGSCQYGYCIATISKEMYLTRGREGGYCYYNILIAVSKSKNIGHSPSPPKKSWLDLPVSTCNMRNILQHCIYTNSIWLLNRLPHYLCGTCRNWANYRGSPPYEDRDSAGLDLSHNCRDGRHTPLGRGESGRHSTCPVGWLLDRRI